MESDEAGLRMLKRNVRNLKGEKSLVSLYINGKQQQTKVKDKKIRKIISTSMMSQVHGNISKIKILNP